MPNARHDLARGRDLFAGRAWAQAHAALARADAATPLDPDDRERLATAAYMIGRDEEWLSGLERAHHEHLAVGHPLQAVRCAFWLCLNFALRGQTAPASGWLGRARRLLAHEQRASVEDGYLLVPVAAQQEAAGEFHDAYVTAGRAVAVGERFGDPDLLAIALHEQGIARVRAGQVAEGLALLDEAMVAVTAGELSPIVTGLVYCSVIEGCQRVFEPRRAQEWTAALARWCAQQPDMVAFTGRCLVHRAEIMQLHGVWADALVEARRAGERCARTANPSAHGEALYRQGELHRLRGDLDAAQAAYREAGHAGTEPQPGLALLRLAAGDHAAAAATIRRAISESDDPLRRARLLPAGVEILLAAGALDEAGAACAELEEIAAAYPSRMLRALAAQARAAVALAGGDARGALGALRSAREVWQELQAPYEAARARVLTALACRALGDADTTALELDAARAAFVELGAAPDVARLDALLQPAGGRDAHGLTPRELEVLRLIAAGATNKGIAAELVVSERTVDRHVSNILNKLRVASRVAATAYAYEHDLV